jgi:hypothetical protein
VLGKANWNIPLDFYPGSFGHPDNLDFYGEFGLDDIRARDEGATMAMRDIARRALDRGRETTLALSDPDEPMVIIKFRAGAASRHVWVDPASAIAFANQPFEDYQLLERYLALWRPNELVEAVIRFAHPLALLPFVDQGSLQSAPIAEVVGAQGETLRLGTASPIGRALLPGDRSRLPIVTLKLEGLTAQTEAVASSRLEAVGNAFLFQFDLVHEGLPRLAELSDDGPRYQSATHRYDRRQPRPLRYPDRTLRPEALRLYHHACTLSDETPLLQFLAYYHVLEFFFPTYSRVVSGQMNRGQLPERKQLRATIERCVDLRQFRRFIETHRDTDTRLTLADLLADPGRLPGMQLLGTRTSDSELLQNLVERIYKLRSRIVHAKDGASSRANEDPIFPFSAEAHQLHPEVEVLWFLSVAVLESSTSLADQPT